LEAHLELQELAIVVPASDGTGVSYANDEQSSGDGVSAGLAIEERNVRRSFCAVMIIQDLSQVLPSRNVDNGSGIRLGHDEAVAVAVLRVWLVSSASKGLKENPNLLSSFCCSLKEDCSCLIVCHQYCEIKQQRRLFVSADIYCQNLN
jgi:hypothetical protein